MENHPNFPPEGLRGIPTRDCITEEGTAASVLFYFNYDLHRPDGWIEQSVCWRDNDAALALTLAQSRPEGGLQFPYGVAVFPKDEVDRLSRLPINRASFACERRPLDGNPYHGNLLLHNSTPRPRMKQIAASLALAVSAIVPQAKAD